MDRLSTITDLTLLIVSIWERRWGVVINPSPHFTEEKTEAQEGVVTFMGRFSMTEPEHPYLYNGDSGPCFSGRGCRQVMHSELWHSARHLEAPRLSILPPLAASDCSHHL